MSSKGFCVFWGGSSKSPRIWIKMKREQSFCLPHHLFTAAEAASSGSQIQDWFRSISTASHPSPAPKAFFIQHFTWGSSPGLPSRALHVSLIQSFLCLLRLTAAIGPQMCFSHFSNHALMLWSMSVNRVSGNGNKFCFQISTAVLSSRGCSICMH